MISTYTSLEKQLTVVFRASFRHLNILEFQITGSMMWYDFLINQLINEVEEKAARNAQNVLYQLYQLYLRCLPNSIPKFCSFHHTRKPDKAIHGGIQSVKFHKISMMIRINTRTSSLQQKIIVQKVCFWYILAVSAGLNQVHIKRWRVVWNIASKCRIMLFREKTV